VTDFVLATANPDKAAEIGAILGPDIGLSPRPGSVEDVEETGDTLEENARIKAQALAEATGRPAIADDTGLEVAALGGRPGVYSARFAGENATYAQNVQKLLAQMRGKSDRSARFRTVALARWPDGRELVAEGEVRGVIAEQARGGDGFGYDPVFVPEGEDRTFAQMTQAEKNDVSHRGRAFRALAVQLRNPRHSPSDT
jgi:XTP/dITP diphosphohydrolase